MSFRFSSPSEEIAIASCTTPQLTVCPAETTLQSEPSSSPEPDFDLEEAEVRVKRDPSADGDSSEAELAQLDVHVKQDPSFDDDDAFNARMEKKEKKTVKKRRCWGQELPAPKTNLPPRYVESPVCFLYLCFLLLDSPSVVAASFANRLCTENAPRHRMKRNSGALSVFCVIALPPRHRANASAKKLKN